MIIEDIHKFCELMTQEKKVMAIDYGQKKTGIAISQQPFILSFPLDLILESNENKKCQKILELVKSHDVKLLVVGLPLNMDGTESLQTEQVKKFVQRLLSLHEVAIYLQDERLTSKTADSLLKNAGLKRIKRNRIDDAVAASLILETVLNYYR